MPKSTLDEDGQRRLAKVMEFSEGKIENLQYAVNKALKGIPERDQRIPLRLALIRRARRKIRDKQKKAPELCKRPHFVITPEVRLDAARHEQQLYNGVPEEDR